MPRVIGCEKLKVLLIRFFLRSDEMKKEERFESYLQEVVDAYPGGPDYAMLRLITRILNDELRHAYPQGGDVAFKDWPSDPRVMLNERLEELEEWFNESTRWGDPLGWAILTEVLNYIRSGGLGVPC
jgi:hypothetical protein